jgi:hypothetical protein
VYSFAVLHVDLAHLEHVAVVGPPPHELQLFECDTGVDGVLHCELVFFSGIGNVVE